MLREQKLSHRIGRAIVATALVALPLIESMAATSAFAKGKPDKPVELPGITSVHGGGCRSLAHTDFSCRFTPQREILFSNNDGSSNQVILGLPGNIDLSNPIFFFCNENITVIVTSRYIIRGAGKWNVDNKSKTQGAEVWDMRQYGSISGAEIFPYYPYFHGNILTVKTPKGFIKIELDDKSKPPQKL